MEEKELLEYIRKNPKEKDGYENALKWCSENVENIDYNNKDSLLLYEITMQYLMRQKIGKWNKADAGFVINYLSRKFANKFEIDKATEIKLLDEKQYEKEIGDSSIATCTDNYDGTSTISYSPKLIEYLVSSDRYKFLRGLQIIFHETVHALQNKVIQTEKLGDTKIDFTETMYIMALETIIRKADRNFYDKNYSKLLKENHAEKIGLKEALKIIKYNETLYEKYDQGKIAKQMQEYDDDFYSGKMTIYDKEQDNAMKSVDNICCLYIKDHLEVLDKFPVLKVGFNNDGTKKDIIQLIKDREKSIKNGAKKEQIDKLYTTVANQKNFFAGGLKGTKDEVMKLHEYIANTGTDDEFVYNLLRYRLERGKLSEQQVEEIIEKEHKIARKVREKNNKENTPKKNNTDVHDNDSDDIDI